MARPDLPYVSLEEPDRRRFAAEDPRGFIATHRDGAIFDEVQHVPDLASYLQVEVDRDPRPGRFILTGSENFSIHARVSQSLAGRTAQEQNLHSLGGDVGISSVTARAWMSVLEASFIVHRVPPFYRNFGKRLVKAPKLHFIDGGLASWLIGVRAPDQVVAHPLRGPLFETWVASEILKSRANRGLPADLYHWRETRGQEIDLVVESADAIRLIEVKSAATIPPDFTRPLVAAREVLRKAKEPRAVECFIIHGGDRRETNHDVTILPWRDIQSVAW